MIKPSPQISPQCVEFIYEYPDKQVQILLIKFLLFSTKQEVQLVDIFWQVLQIKLHYKFVNIQRTVPLGS